MTIVLVIVGAAVFGLWVFSGWLAQLILTMLKLTLRLGTLCCTWLASQIIITTNNHRKTYHECGRNSNNNQY